jgi:hypothetical protein
VLQTLIRDNRMVLGVVFRMPSMPPIPLVVSINGIQSNEPLGRRHDLMPRDLALPDGEPTAITGSAFAGEDRATFSAEALVTSRESEPANDEAVEGQSDDGGEVLSSELTPEEEQQVEELRARDAEVRAHEAAHMAAGGSHVTGGATYSYQVGPDGKSYAVGGEVRIDVSSVPGNPQATIQKMQQVRGAALAPGEPSGADRAVAAQASQIEAQAREQLSAMTAARVSKTYAGAESTGRAPRTGDLVEAQA